MVPLPESSNFICARRTEIFPLALPRLITSANFGCLRRFSMVRVETPKKAANSSSVHCRLHSFSSSTRSILTGFRPAPLRAPPGITPHFGC
jgi:hypothetical protein